MRGVWYLEVEHLQKDADRLRKQRNTAEQERDDAKTQLQQSQREVGVAGAAQQQVMAATAEATTAMAEAMAAAEKQTTAVRGAGHHSGHVSGGKGSMWRRRRKRGIQLTVSKTRDTIRMQGYGSVKVGI